MKVLVRSLRRDEGAVASTVGTIMALLVFLTFLSLIVNQYVPAWMRDSESSHVNGVLGQFGDIKSGIDLRIIGAQAAQNVGQKYIPVVAANSVTLGVDGIPIFAAPTVGTISSSPNRGLFTVVFDYLIQGVRTRVSYSSSGSIELTAQNRYYVPQTIVYENGAVIRYQTDGQVIRALPTFTAGKLNDSLDVSFGLVSVYGTGGASGTSTEVVNTQMFAFDLQDFRNFPSNAVIWINQTSRYGLAWYRFLNKTLATGLGLSGTFVKTSLDVTFTGRIGSTVVYVVSASYNPTTQVYNTHLEIRNNPGLLRLGNFRVPYAQVQVQIGETTQDSQL